ncbi:hypothetical protein RMATCC62417_13125 [Rhizopus microsporus]|nr:hypothetical protein RMATCC62417_13125 [Rhizopus microsporus]
MVVSWLSSFIPFHGHLLLPQLWLYLQIIVRGRYEEGRRQITDPILIDNMVSCTLGMLLCDIFYAGSKIVIYGWLIERIHLVTAVKTSRLRTCQYRVHLLMLCPYGIILALMLSYRNIYLEPDGTCTIGLQLIASVPLLVYDFLLNFYLTWLFMSPLMNVGMTSRANWKKSRLYKLARRTLVASIVSLLISFFNVLVVVITKGHERGLVCLTMCTVDVTVNVVTVHWVTMIHFFPLLAIVINPPFLFIR